MSQKVTTERKTRLKTPYKEQSVQIVPAVYSNYVFENNYYTDVSWRSQEPSEQMWNNQWKIHPFNKKNLKLKLYYLYIQKDMLKLTGTKKRKDTLARSISGWRVLPHPPQQATAPLHCTASAVGRNKNTCEDLVKAAAGQLKLYQVFRVLVKWFTNSAIPISSFLFSNEIYQGRHELSNTCQIKKFSQYMLHQKLLSRLYPLGFYSESEEWPKFISDE